MSSQPLRYRWLATLTLLALLVPLTPYLPVHLNHTSVAASRAELTLPNLEPIALTLLNSTQAIHLDQQARIRINEVMPKPDVGEFEWIELYASGAHRVYLPLVLRNASSSDTSTRLPEPPRPVLSARTGLFDISGWQVTDEDGNAYTIPDALPPVPPEAYILIIFDGRGPADDDYDLSDGLAVLHAQPGLTGKYEDAADQVALYVSSSHNPATIVDFVAWGEPPGHEAANAAAAGLWVGGWYASFETGFGAISEADLLAANESLGRFPGGPEQGREAFALYQDSQLSPGGANPVPVPSFYTPEDGAIVETTNFSVGWSGAPGATRYQFQLDDDVEFGSPVVDTTVDETYFKPPAPLPEGTYYWRVKPLGGQGTAGPWMGPVEIGIAEFPASSSVGTTSEPNVELGISPVRQNKDSRLLCLDSDSEGNPYSNVPEDAWDAPAPCTVLPCTDYTKFAHGWGYCVPASIRMMASHYGGTLSMDRIAYHVKQEWEGNTRPDTNDSDPNNDLAHGQGMYSDEVTEGISWALGTPIEATRGYPGFNEVKSFIDAGRPIMFGRSGHMMVIDGYAEWYGVGWVHVLDPDQPPDFERWQLYMTQAMDRYWPGPASASGVRSDEDSMWADSDGDGIVDFDEENRFDTRPSKADSDGDGVPDKADMREYVFEDYTQHKADWDNDHLRKEIDPDNDNDGSEDGCEDTNYNGSWEPWLGETLNFSDTLKQPCPNDPPNQPSNPTPADGATDQSLTVDLSWTGGDPDDDEVLFDVYFDAGTNPPTTLVSDDQASTTYAPDALTANTYYYWKVVAQDQHGATTEGLVWEFTTTAGDGPSPGDMISIPAGEFQMGCDSTNPNESCHSWEQPLHAVYLSAFHIDKYEVTNGQYAQCVAAGVCDPPLYDKSQTRPSYFDNPAYADYPVIYVSWYNAAAYCAWAGRRLPTEAEWEKAARGSSDTRMYPWGNQAADCTLANFRNDGLCVGDTSRVGDYPMGQSPYGAMDMSGNVSEWVKDWFDSFYYSVSPYSNPPGPINTGHRVIRGGSWSFPGLEVRAAYRYSDVIDPTRRYRDVGFRCADSPGG